jgi:uncharacterized protein (DUF433 family)
MRVDRRVERVAAAIDHVIVKISRCPEKQQPAELRVMAAARTNMRRTAGSIRTQLKSSPPAGGRRQRRAILPFLEVASFQSAAMDDDALLNRITADPEIFGGKPIVRGMRISVELILRLMAQGQAVEAILDDYPELEADDVRACLAYAHAALADESLEAVRVTSV